MKKNGWKIPAGLLLGFFSLFALILQAQEQLQKGVELFQSQKYVEAIEALKLALREDPKNEGILFQLGLAQFMAGQLTEAKVSYQEALQIKPDLWEGHFNLGLVFYTEQKNEEALQHFLKAEELNPKSYQPFFFSARTFELLGKPGEAASAYQHALDNASSNQEKGECHLGLARLALAKKDFPAVERELTNARLVQAEPGTLEVLTLQYYLAADLREQALELLKKLISRQPNDVRLNELIAGLYFENSKFTESAHFYQIAARNATDLAAQRALWLLAAQAYEKAGDPQNAIEILAPLALKSKDLDLFMQIGAIYMHQRQFDQAEKAFGAALQLKPECAPCWSNLGSAFLLQEKHPQALDCFLRFSKLNPQIAGTYFYMATIYDKYGDAKNAISNYQKFLDLDQGKTETQDFQARQRIKTLENRLKRR